MGVYGMAGAGVHAIVNVEGVTVVLGSFSLSVGPACLASCEILAPSIMNEYGRHDKWLKTTRKGDGMNMRALQKCQADEFCYALERVAQQVEKPLFENQKDGRGWWLPAIALGALNGADYLAFNGCGPPWDRRGEGPGSCLVRSKELFQSLSPDRQYADEKRALAVASMGSASIESTESLELGLLAYVRVLPPGAPRVGGRNGGSSGRAAPAAREVDDVELRRAIEASLRETCVPEAGEQERAPKRVREGGREGCGGSHDATAAAPRLPRPARQPPSWLSRL